MKFNQKKYNKQHRKVFKPYKKLLKKANVKGSDKYLKQLV